MAWTEKPSELKSFKTLKKFKPSLKKLNSDKYIVN